MNTQFFFESDQFITISVCTVPEFDAAVCHLGQFSARVARYRDAGTLHLSHSRQLIEVFKCDSDLFDSLTTEIGGYQRQWRSLHKYRKWLLWLFLMYAPTSNSIIQVYRSKLTLFAVTWSAGQLNVVSSIDMPSIFLGIATEIDIFLA